MWMRGSSQANTSASLLGEMIMSDGEGLGDNLFRPSLRAMV
jgi:hypothetical protein